MSPTTQSPDTGGPSAQRDGSHDDPERPSAPRPPPADAIHEAFARLTELKEFASYYAAARVDAWRATLRNVGIYAGLGLVALAGGAALVATAVVLLLLGIAGAFAQIFSGHPWLGDIITSVIFLGFLGGSVLIGMKVLRKTFHNMTVEKYESRQSHQREQFGHSVRDEAKRAERAQFDRTPGELSESEYLAQQAHNAQLAMSRAWQDIKLRLGQGIDPLAWTKQHPWMALAAAAAAGFVATTAIVPSKEQQALNKLTRIERALNPAPEHSNGDSKHEKGGLLGTILHEAIGVLRPVLMGLITANLGNAAPPGAQQPPADDSIPDGQ